MEKTLLGKRALVTGSTSGLGREIAESLAAAGCDVALNGFGDPAEIEALRVKVEQTHGNRALFCPANLTVPGEIREHVASVVDQWGGIDILVNNAGTQFVSPLETFPEEKWDMLIALNLSAAFHTTKAVVPGMRERKWGRIINISSAHGLVASPFKAAYVASKHGLIGLTKVTALETARDGITCNALCPGFIHTAIVDQQIEAQAQAAGVPWEKVVEDIILAKHATKEFVRADQVAAYVFLLCSDAGSSTTGAAIPIDGGWVAA